MVALPNFLHDAVINCPPEVLYPLMAAWGTFSRSHAKIALLFLYEAKLIFTEDTRELKYPRLCNK